MDVEVDAKGSLFVISLATWRMRLISLGEIIGSDLAVVKCEAKQCQLDEAETRRLLSALNTPEDLEYAASLSSDGLELFYTSMRLADLESGRIRSSIWRSVRQRVQDPFGPPKMISSIGSDSFVEGPSISPDRRTLYYHERSGKTSRLMAVRRELSE
jgi:hypothetical protein